MSKEKSKWTAIALFVFAAMAAGLRALKRDK